MVLTQNSNQKKIWNRFYTPGGYREEGSEEIFPKHLLQVPLHSEMIEPAIRPPFVHRILHVLWVREGEQREG